MKKIIISLFVLTMCNNISAQKVIELNNIIGFNSEYGEFLISKKKNKLTYLEIDFYKNEIDFDTSDTDNNNFTPINKIKSLRLDQFNEMLENKSFILQRDSNKIVTLAKINHAIGYSEYTYPDYDIEDTTITHYVVNGDKYGFLDAEFYSYFYIKLKKDKYILAVVSDYNYNSQIEGFIVPLSDGLEIMRTKLKYTDYYNGNEADQKKYIEELNANSFYDVKNIKKGEYQLIDGLGQQLIPTSEDIIFLENIIYSKNPQTKLYTAYNAFLENLNIDNIRSVGYKKDFNATELLIGNNLRYMGTDGKLTNHLFVNKMFGYCGTVASYNDKLYKKDNIWYLEKDVNAKLIAKESTTTVYKLVDGENIDSISFSNSLDHIYYNDNNKNLIKKQLSIKKKNGKYNICYYTTSDTTFSLQEQLTYDCDSLKIGEYSYFYDNGLVGCYPIMKSVKYKSIPRLYESFIRFQLPSGKEGWLNIKTKKEYLDILNEQ